MAICPSLTWAGGKEEHMIRKLLSAAMLCAISAAIIGCEASAHVDTDEDHDHDTVKRTTVEHNDGDRTVKTEIHEHD